MVGDPNSQLAQALSGDLTGENISDTAGIGRLKSASNLQIRAVTVPQFYWLSLHPTNPLFSSVKVRQAVQYAIDRKTMIKTLLNGYGSVANRPHCSGIEVLLGS